jgi:hypothetical protein
MARRLAALAPALLIGVGFLILIRGIGWEGSDLRLGIDRSSFLYVEFLILLFVYISALAGFFHPGSWHQAFSALRVPTRPQILLFGGMAALNILREQVGETAMLAKLQYGKHRNPVKRFMVLLRAGVPLFYASLIKLEAGLISLKQRQVYSHAGVQIAYSANFYLRGWLSITAASAVTLYLCRPLSWFG